MINQTNDFQISIFLHITELFAVAVVIWVALIWIWVHSYSCIWFFLKFECMNMCCETARWFRAQQIRSFIASIYWHTNKWYKNTDFSYKWRGLLAKFDAAIFVVCNFTCSHNSPTKYPATFIIQKSALCCAHCKTCSIGTLHLYWALQKRASLPLSSIPTVAWWFANYVMLLLSFSYVTCRKCACWFHHVSNIKQCQQYIRLNCLLLC